MEDLWNKGLVSKKIIDFCCDRKHSYPIGGPYNQ